MSENLVREFYNAIGSPVLSAKVRGNGQAVISELLHEGRTVEEIRCAISYVRDNPGSFDRPPFSIGILPHVIHRALDQERQRAAAQARRARLKADEERLIAADTERAQRYLRSKEAK